MESSPKTLCKRIIPCLDVKNGRTVKGVQFTGLRDVGDPVELAEQYQEQGADELMFLDISASVEGRATMVGVVRNVAHRLMIPFAVGGGISKLEDAKRLLDAGADKVSVNTAAVLRPELITEIATAFGSQCCVLAIDAKRNGDGWEVLTHGGNTRTGLDALSWAKQAVELGAGEILLTSWDQDGTRQGFDLALTRAFSQMLPVPVIASGGASGPDSFIDVFREGCADAALAASIFHDGQWRVDTLKEIIQKEGIPIRR
ncbi:MAG TPA: imidazole glycerol phosphate synthase subunit HisF [Oculatellaceae cyanobacterium]|jgi:cyclase